MKTNTLLLKTTHLRRAALALVATLCALATPVAAQNTTGGTVISNTATATYTDGTNSYNASSNTVTVTVANVSGLTITPDAQNDPSVVPGQTGVDFRFTVTNTGNFADQVRFLTGGASVHLNDNSLASVAEAVVDDGTTANAIDATDTRITGNAADVLKAVAQGGSLVVIVRVNISASAPPSQTLTVFLGDASADNVLADTSANEVRTVATTSVNGLREAVGSINAAIQNDVQLRAVLSAPPGPVALGSNITYTASVCNDGARPAAAMTLGTNSGVYVVAPIPAGTQLSASNTFPAGTLYTTSTPLATNPPESATWTTTAPSPLSSTTRVAFNAGATLAGGTTCSSNFSLIVTITTNNANTPIYQIVDAFAKNTVLTVVTDQSGDNATNTGDRNADFNEPVQGQPGVSGKGFKIPTLLLQSGSVLIGPAGSPAAIGTDNNNDFTNLSTRLGINHPPCVGPPVAACQTDVPDTITFTNTVQNTGNANDTFTLTAPTVPAGFLVEVSTNGGTSWTTVSGGGSTSVAVAFGSTANIQVRVTAPAGQAVLTAYATTVRAASGITPASTNDTIDRLYTGFIRLDKTAIVTNGTGVGGATDAVPGAEIEYVITYTNLMSVPAAGSGSTSLAATNLVITENGTTGGNNWGNALPGGGTVTTQVVNAASDVNTTGTPGNITGHTLSTSTVLTDTITTLPAGGNGTFRFKRRIT
ncbi:MAG TPA: hypothetical protein VF538_06625 [Pyrinomonadaceae bacterium]|jgi:hypothetical protein